MDGWNVIRLSYGLMGAVMSSADALLYAEYLHKHLARRPPDHLLVEWYAGETQESAVQRRDRQHLTFKYNMFGHLGTTSSLRGGKMPGFAKCYDYLEPPVLFEVRLLAFGLCACEPVWRRATLSARWRCGFPATFEDLPWLCSHCSCLGFTCCVSDIVCTRTPAYACRSSRSTSTSVTTRTCRRVTTRN